MKISVITVNLNGSRFLTESIESVLGQNHQEVELVIVDGCSTDESLAIIEAAAGRDCRVRWISEPDKGIADAMNKGISLTSGDIVGFLHSDDRYPEPGTLSAIAAEFVATPDAVWLTGGIDLINAQGETFRSYRVRRFNYTRLVRSNILFHPATFVRTDALRGCGMFDPGLRLAMDYDLWLRLGALGDPILLDRSSACFRVHGDSRSIRAAGDALAEEFAIRCRFLRGMGRRLFPFYLDYQVKRILNMFFIRRLTHLSAQGLPHA